MSAYDQFLASHKAQLESILFPPNLYPLLHKKLVSNEFDVGEYFRVLDNENTENYEAITLQNITKEANVFLIDHIFTFTSENLLSTLLQSEKAVTNLMELLKYAKNKHPIPSVVDIKKSINEKFQSMSTEEKSKSVIGTIDAELDNGGLTTLKGLALNPNVEALSLMGNEIVQYEDLIPFIKEYVHLKAIWLNNTPISENPDFQKTMAEYFPNLQILNSKFTSQASEWALLYLSKKKSIQEITYLNLSDRNILILPDLLWPKLQYLDELNICGIEELLYPENIPKLFKILESLTHLSKIECSQDMLDFLWGNLKQLPQIKFINGFDVRMQKPKQEKVLGILDICHNIWKAANFYKLSMPNQIAIHPYWYVMDLLGTAIMHSDTPNFIVLPFMYSPTNQYKDSTPISIMWPIKDVANGEYIYRDYLFQIDEKKFRSAKLSIWYDIPYDFYSAQYNKRKTVMDSIKDKTESLWKQHLQIQETKRQESPKEANLKVFTDTDAIIQYLKHPSFTITADIYTADVIWLCNDSYKFIDEKCTLKPSVLRNQFSYENCLVYKSMLAKSIKELYNSH